MSEQLEITAKLDAQSLEEAWAKKKGTKPKFALDIHFGARTDLGRVRENNEDKFEFFVPEEPEMLAVKGSYFAVADGMGGHASGQIASELALKHIVKSFYSDPSDDVAQGLVAAYRVANSYIYDAAQMITSRQGMGTTCTSIVLRDDEMFAGQVGDSRLYRIRGEEMRQISQDHSWVAEQVRMGVLTEQEAALSPFRNVITRSIGTYPDVEPDIFCEKLEKDDVFVLCSDGLSGYVSDADIHVLASSHSPAVAALKLIDLANENGGGDNVTVLIVAVRDIQKPTNGGGGGYFQKLLGRS